MPKKLSKKQRAGTKILKAEKYLLRLFITGILPNSARAVVNSKAICEKYLKGRYKLEIIDIYQQPALALTEDIIAVPVLIKKFPLPEERIIGDMSDPAEVLNELHLS
jgi:circadian clock protein KaiB